VSAENAEDSAQKANEKHSRQCGNIARIDSASLKHNRTIYAASPEKNFIYDLSPLFSGSGTVPIARLRVHGIADARMPLVGITMTMKSYNDVLTDVATTNERTAAADGDPIRMWLVDDDDEYRSLMAQLLTIERGFDCAREFPSPAGVLDALSRESPPDVILLDIRMRGQNGLDAIRPIKTIAPSTRIVMLTTFFDGHAKARALREGASDLLLKSYELEEIARRIRRVIEKQDAAVTEAEAGITQLAEREKEFCGEGRLWKNRSETAFTGGGPRAILGWFARRLDYLRGVS
jgi:DNA-binding NarL/FixJ family response regulator